MRRDKDTRRKVATTYVMKLHNIDSIEIFFQNKDLVDGARWLAENHTLDQLNDMYQHACRAARH